MKIGIIAMDSEGSAQKSLCAWCGKRIEKGYHGDSKSIFMRSYKFYCSLECRKADSLPDWACFPVFLIPCAFIMAIILFIEGLFETNLFGTLTSIGLVLVVSVLPFWEIKGILKIRKEIPKGSRLE